MKSVRKFYSIDRGYDFEEKKNSKAFNKKRAHKRLRKQLEVK